MNKIRNLTDEQKQKFYIYKEVKEISLPNTHVWKVWFPLPDAMFKGMWLQYSSLESALSEITKFKNQEDIEEYIAELFKDDGGW